MGCNSLPSKATEKKDRSANNATGTKTKITAIQTGDAFSNKTLTKINKDRGWLSSRKKQYWRQQPTVLNPILFLTYEEHFF